LKAAAAGRRLGWGLLIWLAGVGMLSGPAIGAQSRDERAVRAAYVYNLIPYVAWPAQEKELTIGFVGDAATGTVMKQLLEGRSSNGRTIRVALDPADEELQKCDVLYLDDAPAAEARKALEKVKGRSVLTVGETEGFARDGGMIGLVNTGDHIRIEVNLEATQAAKIRISSRVLNLATIVAPAQKGGS
jgi:YfiR/HmsC-like